MIEKQISFEELFRSATKADHDETNDLYIPQIKLSSGSFEFLDNGIITLQGNKVLLRDDDKFNFATNGSGSVIFNSNRLQFSVTNDGDYAVAQARRNAPYYEGNYQKFEITAENFAPETDVEKYYGYFDFQSTGIDFTKIDGLFLLSANDKVYYKVYNEGTEIYSIDITNEISDWNNFFVFVNFFLWIGGAINYPFLFKENGNVKNIGTYTHVGKSGTFIKNPQKGITFAIKSTGGAGTGTYICSTVGTKIIKNASGVTVNAYNKTQIAANTVGTYYHLKTFKIDKDYRRGASVFIEKIGLNTATNNDAGILLVCKNTTLPGTITYGALYNSIIEQSTNEEGTVITEANIGEVVDSFNFSANGSPEFVFTNAIEKQIEISLGDTESPTYSLIYLPQTINQTVATNITFIEYR